MPDMLSLLDCWKLISANASARWFEVMVSIESSLLSPPEVSVVEKGAPLKQPSVSLSPTAVLASALAAAQASAILRVSAHSSSITVGTSDRTSFQSFSIAATGGSLGAPTLSPPHPRPQPGRNPYRGYLLFPHSSLQLRSGKELCPGNLFLFLSP